jgi:cell division protein FtsZ
MINFHPGQTIELKPRITVIGVGGAGGNAVNNMIQSSLEGVEFIVANTDAQAMAQSRTERRIQLGATVTQGLGAGARPDIGRAAAEETLDELLGQIQGSNMVFITAGMGGGTGTGAAPVIARAAREHGILTVGVVTKPFQFEGAHRMRLAEAGIEELTQYVDTLIIIPNQNLFRVASERTTFADAFKMADDVLYSGVRGVTDLMIMPGLINLDFADIRTVMSEMGKAMMGTGEAEGEKRALQAAEAAISNPLLEDISMKGARGMLINITGGMDMTLFEVDEAANRIREEVDPDANIIFGSTFDEKLDGKMRVSVVATGIDAAAQVQTKPTLISLVEKNEKRRSQPNAFRSTLADLAAVGHVFNGAAAVAQPEIQPVEEPAMVQPRQAPVEVMDADDDRDFQEPTFEMPAEPVVEPVHRQEPTFALRPAPARREPSQGTLMMDLPAAPRHELRPEMRVEPRLDMRPAVASLEPEEVAETPRRPSFIDRLTGQARQASHTTQQRVEPVAPIQPVAYEPPPAPATRVTSPADRPTGARTDEDFLDIPAFLRRQAN